MGKEEYIDMMAAFAMAGLLGNSVYSPTTSIIAGDAYNAAEAMWNEKEKRRKADDKKSK